MRFVHVRGTLGQITTYPIKIVRITLDPILSSDNIITWIIDISFLYGAIRVMK
jgi:hypothetical protein